MDFASLPGVKSGEDDETDFIIIILKISLMNLDRQSGQSRHKLPGYKFSLQWKRDRATSQETIVRNSFSLIVYYATHYQVIIFRNYLTDLYMIEKLFKLF